MQGLPQETTSKESLFCLFVMPNAGIPENVGGLARYPLCPGEFTRYLSHFVRDLGVSIVGGCCGTTKEHIRQLVEAVGNCIPVERTGEVMYGASSLYQAVPFHIDPSPVLVGERTNANGSKQFRELLIREDWEGIVAMGKEALREGAHMLDLCAAYVGRDERRDMIEIVSRFNTRVTLPLMIDSTEPGYLAGLARGCVVEAQRVDLEREALDLHAGIARLLGTDRAFLFAPSSGYGTTVAIETKDCAEVLKTYEARVAKFRAGRGEQK